MQKLSILALSFVLVTIAGAQSPPTWRYYRPSNTGIQGDWCGALRVGPDGDPWIGGFDASFEEGGIARLIQAENRWENVSNVDYPVIGHPSLTGISRISDIDADSSGRLWMATGRGGLTFDPRLGPKSLRRFGDDNSPIPGGWNRGVEVAPDGSVWFSSYSTVWGAGGIARYEPVAKRWTVFSDYGGGTLAVQPQPGGGYFVWTHLGPKVARFNSQTGTWAVLPKTVGRPAIILGKNATDSAGNVWMQRWTDVVFSESRLGLRRPDGSWHSIPPPPFESPTNSVAVVRALGPRRALVVDSAGAVFRFDGTRWIDLGVWQPTWYTEDVDEDARGNIWVCGSGGAARRDAVTGAWQRYRITNTAQFDFFNADLSVDAAGNVVAGANAGPGYGGMVRFDGVRWTGFNQAHYGLGFDWPFPSDNCQHVLLRPSGEVLANPTFGFVHGFAGGVWTDYHAPHDDVGDLREDSLGRLWLTDTTGVYLRSGTAWTRVSELPGSRIVVDPTKPGAIWTFKDDVLLRTDGVSTLVRRVTDFAGLDPQSDQFKGLVVDAGGNAWIGANTINLPDNSQLIRWNPDTGAIRAFRAGVNWPFPGQYLMPLAATPDGRIWMQYDSDYLVAQRGLCWFDGTRVGRFPAPPFGDPQWGGLPHAQITDLEVRRLAGGYELWMACASRGIAVLTVRTGSGPVR